MKYSDFFTSLTGFSPYPWQERFSRWDGSNVALVNAPTGAGKEAGAVIPWLYSYETGNPTTTRLAYALPTRSLVDQVYSNTLDVVERSGLSVIKVYCLKGGKIESGFEQDLTQPCILIGTQDQLLSRALNRGFGVSWGQKSLHCAALTNDCRWILDEIQLTGVGYNTLVQLYRQWLDLGTFGSTQLCLMSATFDETPLKDLAIAQFELDADDLAHPILGSKVERPKPVNRAEVDSPDAIAKLVRQQHQPGYLSLVVMNQVKRARELGEQLADLNPLVIHSRFLGIDREKLQDRLKGYQGLLIATQVVEAGVDLDADLLITELCPWSSFVQRCGRCGRTRTDNQVQIYWLDYQQDWQALPYKQEECEATRDRLLGVTDASLHQLAQMPLPDLDLPRYPLGKKEVETFFRTHYKTRDNYHEISKYVRDAHNFTVSVVWSVERPKRLPHQRFLCPVPEGEFKQFCQTNNVACWVWGDDVWEQKEPAKGDVAWLPIDAGGYSHQRGWTGNANDKPIPYSLEVEPEYNDPPFAFNLELGVHLKDTEDALRQFILHLQRLGLSDELIDELLRCARWHDWGKAHPVWQTYANAEDELLAKSKEYGTPREMKGYRHELASAFAAASQGTSFLSQYLIAAHHGKVRDSLWPTNPKERFNPKVLRGVELGTNLPSFEINGVETLPSVKLSFSGKAATWDKQVKTLLRQYGPFKLIYLEALIRNADVQASKTREEEASHDRNCNH